MAFICVKQSDPGVFTELISAIGVEDVEVTEIYSLDESEQVQESSSYGLIFLFKWRQETDDRPVIDPLNIPSLFYAQQVVTNACATQAILSVLLNAEGVEIGETLRNFKSFVGHFDAETRGETIGNDEVIRTAHNSFARPEPFVGDEKPKRATDKDDLYHFIAYVPHAGSVYELDGLKRGPIHLGSYDAGVDWRTVAKPAIEERMQRYAAIETTFNLLTISRSRASILQEQLEAAEETGADVMAIMQGLEEEIATKERQKQENARRKHNYIPFIMELLKTLSKKGKLAPMIEAASEAATVAAAAATAAAAK